MLGSKKVDVGLPEKGNSKSHGARPVHSIITMIKGFGPVVDRESACERARERERQRERERERSRESERASEREREGERAIERETVR